MSGYHRVDSLLGLSAPMAESSCGLTWSTNIKILINSFFPYVNSFRDCFTNNREACWTSTHSRLLDEAGARVRYYCTLSSTTVGKGRGIVSTRVCAGIGISFFRSLIALHQMMSFRLFDVIPKNQRELQIVPHSSYFEVHLQKHYSHRHCSSDRVIICT